MNSRARTSQQIRKIPPIRENEYKVGMQGTRSSSSEKASTSGRRATKEKKLALLQDVDRMKKKLRDEENIHRALQRAYNRPLGALPRLPPYLPPNTQELLAEIAVLEEEVVRLEEQVVNYRQNLYQEAVYICSKRKLENPADYYEQILSRVSKEEHYDREKSPVSVVIRRTASTSSEMVSDQSSLSLGNTASASSDIISDQAEQSSRSLMKEKRALDEQPSIVDSGESGKAIGNQTCSSSNQKSDMISYLTETSSCSLINGKQTMDDVNSTADSWVNKEGKGNQTCFSPNQSVNNVSRPTEECSSGLTNGTPASNDLSSSMNTNKNGKLKDEDHIYSSSTRNSQLSERKLSRIKTPVRKASFKHPSSQKSVNLKQPENKALGGYSEPNKISEDILKCLCSIFIRMSTSDKGTRNDTLPYSLSLVSSQMEKAIKIQDPYRTGVELKERDIGLYKGFCVVDAKTIDIKRKKNALFLLHKLKLLLGKLARVNLDDLTHQHKLAFWINTYNSCLMNTFLEHGIPESPENVVLLTREAAIVVAGQRLSAITIEHFILRAPFYLKHGGKKTAARGGELKASEMFGLECAEPLITFALSSGSWSSPAIRVYTASQVESDLKAAKREYLQAAVGVSKRDKLIIPKLLEWFQPDLESLLDWVCHQLPDELRKEALFCLQRKGKQPLSELVEFVPFDFTFRYLLLS